MNMTEAMPRRFRDSNDPPDRGNQGSSPLELKTPKNGEAGRGGVRRVGAF